MLSINYIQIPSTSLMDVSTKLQMADTGWISKQMHIPLLYSSFLSVMCTKREKGIN